MNGLEGRWLYDVQRHTFPTISGFGVGAQAQTQQVPQ